MSTSSPRWQQLIEDHRRGQSLAQPFYVERELFEIEVERFLAAHWMIAGHVSQIPRHGDYFTFEAMSASVIVVRAADGEIHALHNVCRHRGARICEDAAGHSSLLRCRYHGWTYRLDGGLVAWRHMPEELNKRDYGLRRCGVALFNGLILISLEPDRAPDPIDMTQHVTRYWDRYALEDCKVIARRTYCLRANWKLGIENNLECYHCLPSHPEYTAANAFVRADEKVSDAVVADFTAYHETWRARMTAAGAPTGRSELIETQGQLCRAGTWPLAPGHLTASSDGRGVAPLLGNVAAYDESVTTGCVGFLSYVVALCDYALIVTYLPQSATLTNIDLKWMVRADAIETRDYEIEKVCWLWDETTRQDKNIIELNAAGVASRGYAPGPYSQLEWMTMDFIERYLALMGADA